MWFTSRRVGTISTKPASTKVKFLHINCFKHSSAKYICNQLKSACLA